MTSPEPRRLVIGISGASGAVYGVRLLEVLRHADVETHLVLSRAAGITLKEEMGLSISDVRALADQSYNTDDISAAISSGSFRTMGMVVAPCSMKSLAEIASGVTGSLLPRAADVVLKDRRRLVLMVRETPLHLGHIRNMAAAAEMGAIIAPPVPAFYSRPTSIDDIVDHSIGRVLDLFGMELGLVRRWREQVSPQG